MLKNNKCFDLKSMVWYLQTKTFFSDSKFVIGEKESRF